MYVANGCSLQRISHHRIGIEHLQRSERINADASQTVRINVQQRNASAMICNIRRYALDHFYEVSSRVKQQRTASMFIRTDSPMVR